MADHEEILSLRKQLEEAKAQLEAVRRNTAAERRSAEAERRNAEAERRSKEAEQRKYQKTTLEEYLFNCHFYLYKQLRLADESQLSTGFTKVDGKYYPKWLRPWTSFTDLHRQYHFEAISTVCGKRRLFQEETPTRYFGAMIQRRQGDNEYFEAVALEDPVWEILRPLWDDEKICQEYQCRELRFSNNPAREEELSEGRQERRPPLTKPERAGIRTHIDGSESLAFVSDYKAAHDIALEYLKPAITNEKLFMEVIGRANSSRSQSDTGLREQAEELIAMALTQAFDCMIRYGVAYGYIAAGKSLLFLHIDQADPQTLYYHPCVPDEDVGDGSHGDWADNKASYTAVAQLASFCLLSLRSKALRGAFLDAKLQNAEATLRKWSEPYDDDGPDGNPPGSRAGTSVNKRKDHTWGSSSENKGGDKEEEMPDSAPTNQYCTQACLLGLMRDSNLDDNCPNVLSHRTTEVSGHHAIDAGEFARLVGKQLCQNPYRKCEALDRSGKNGASGVLFKLELVQYGYTFVGKGTLPGCHGLLEHESRIYARLDKLQGEVVPVHLGLVRLDWGYVLPGGARIFDMMLMSWGGETVTAGAGAVDLRSEVRRSSQDVWAEGVDHGDERNLNRLWNDERRRVMLIDFDRATLHCRLKRQKQLSEVSGKKRKRHTVLGNYGREVPDQPQLHIS